nr:nesprin-1 isoform X7 [Onthophagus taurus]
MSNTDPNRKEQGKPPDIPGTPSRRLSDRVSFFEKVWSGSPTGDVTLENIEKVRSPERKQLHQKIVRPDGSFEETLLETMEEGDLASGMKTVKFEKVTVKKTVKEVKTSRTPSEEKLIEDSAYHTEYGNGLSYSKSSSVTSLTGRSEESLSRPSSREQSRDEWDSNSTSSKVTTSSLDWYNEYRSQSFQQKHTHKEYYRSKSEYDNHIAIIRDEQERVQKKTFVNWINSYLSKHVPPLKVEDLIEDLRDGTKLLALLEVLSGEKLPVERGRVLRRPHFLSNHNTALQFLQTKRIKLVNINSSDLVDGRPPIVLGLIWTIILYFQIEENSRALEYLTHWESTSSLESAGTTSSIAKDKWKQGARKTLLQWVSNALPSDAGIEVKDFGASWRDGVAFLALIDAIKANLINLAEMRKESNRARLETAFDVAESQLGIARLLDPEDVDVPKPDERSIMTYVAQFLHKYPEPKGPSSDAFTTLQEKYNELLSWLLKKTQYLEHLQHTNSLPLNFDTYLAFKQEVDEKEVTFNRLRNIVESQSLVSITRESWIELDRLWSLLQFQLLQWLWLLDSKLPGDFKFVGEWLAKAERLLNDNEIPDVMNEETAAIISRKLEEHKAFFLDLPTVQNKFLQAYNSPLAREVPSAQLSNMHKRLNDVGPKAAQRRVKLKFLEHKCCLIAFLQLTEMKLKSWTSKYESLDKVVQHLEQYRNFVSKNHIFQEFNKAFIDMEAVIEEYKRDGNISKRESSDVDKFISNIGERWKGVSMELRCVQSMLEEVVAHWRRWNSASVEFENWLNKAEHAITLPEEQCMEFFQDISVWKANYQLLGDTVSFLIATCENKVAMEMRDQYTKMTERWEKLYPIVNRYSHAGDILRNRKDFRAGIEVLTNWLQKAEGILNNQELESTEKIKLHLEKLQGLQGEVESTENLFKNISKTFQTLIQDLSRDEVDRMMGTLKNQKESLVKIRALIPMQIHLFNQLLVQQQSLESGQKEINQWLDDAESLLSSLVLTPNRDELTQQLDTHKKFFTRTLYYKSMLESKNKVLRNIIKAVDQTSNVDVEKINSKMEQLNDRFAYVTQNAQLWEQKLQDTIRCLFNFKESERVIADWLNKAEQLIAETRIDTKQAVEMHKSFFERVNERWIHELVQNAQDLCKCLPNEERPPIIESVEALQKKWKEILSFAPLHLMRLEFRLDETTFGYYIKKIENEIKVEQVALSKNENVDAITAKNKEFFAPDGALLETRKCLEGLKTIAKNYAQYQPGDKVLQEACEKAEVKWKSIHAKMKSLQDQLEHIPEQWSNYHDRFAKMESWMNGVDDVVGNLFKNVASIEQFEDEKNFFQKICQDADAKREEVKWLVQTLDFLTSHCSESQALTEQTKLEALILRYKNLLPNLEVSMVKTDVLTKCYVYRREVYEVCELLTKVKEQTKREPIPENLEIIHQLIKQQEVAVQQLDLQRSNIMSMLQKGRELAKEEHAPKFVEDNANVLELEWNNTFEGSVDRLRKLKHTQNLWSNYSEQKQEIVTLLAQAENDLKKISSKHYDYSNLPAELQAKQNMSIHLRETTEEMLRRLRDLCDNLMKITPPEKKPALQKEVHDIEQRLHTTLVNVDEHVVFLEQVTTKWGHFQHRIFELQNWTVQNAPKLLTITQEFDAAPEERAVTATLLKSQLAEKINLLEDVQKEASELMPDETDSADTQKIKAELAALKHNVYALNTSVEQQVVTVNRDLEHYKLCQTILHEINPWVEVAESKISSGLGKPATLQEAECMHKELEQFAIEYDQNLQKLRGAIDLSHHIESKTTAPEEINAMRSRFSVVESAKAQNAKKLEKLIANWKEFNTNADNIKTWIQDKEKLVAESQINLDTPVTEKLERELAKLKSLGNEVSEQHAKLITLTQASDSISHNLTPEGASGVKLTVHELKEKILRLADNIRKRINSVSDAILARHEFQTTLSNFTTWVNQMNTNVDQIDSIRTDKIEQVLNTLHEMHQEYSEREPAFVSIYEEVKRLNLMNTAKENEPLNQEYSYMVDNYQKIETKLRHKKEGLEKWKELLNWHHDTDQQLSHIKYNVESQKPNVSTLKQHINEIDAIITKVIACKKTASDIDKYKEVIILDKTSENQITAEQLVREIEIKSINLKSHLSDKVKGLEEMDVRWKKLKDLQHQIYVNIENLQHALAHVYDNVITPTDLEAVIDKLSNVLEMHLLKIDLKDKLQKEGHLLIKDDVQQATVIQNILSTVEANWNKFQDNIRQQKLTCSELLNNWKDFLDDKDKIQNDLIKIVENCESIQTPNDSIQANLNNEKSKKALEAIRRVKIVLDKLDVKTDQLIKSAELVPQIEKNVKDELRKTHDDWSKAYEKVLKLSQMTESQNVIWKNLDETKNKITQWLTHQNSCILSALEKPNEVEIAQHVLAKYREELPANLSLKQSIPNKCKQLLKLNEKDEQPSLTSLMKVIDDEFEEVNKNAEKLDLATSLFGEKEKAVRTNIKDVNNQISTIRENIIKCEDLSGENTQILERLQTCQVLKRELCSCEPKIKNIEQNIQELKNNYPTVLESGLPKEHQNLKKRYDGLLIHANKIEASLLGFLKKFHNEKYAALNRIIQTQKEKVQWCLPEPTSDRYNLEVKLSTLAPIQAALLDCDKRKAELEQSLKVLEGIESPESIKLLAAEKGRLLSELDTLKQSYSNTKKTLEEHIKLFEKHEDLSQKVSIWLKDVENRVRVENTTQIDLDHVDDKIIEIEKLLQSVTQHQNEFKNLTELSNQIIEKLPESRVAQYAQHLNTRYQAIIKFLSNYIEKLNELNNFKKLYKDSIGDVENWLVQAQEKVQSFKEYTAKSSRPNQSTLNELKKFAAERERGQQLLNRAVENGEALFSGITSENREAIRAELRGLRDKSETLIDEVNAIYKQVENILMKRHSFDDSLAQVRIWLEDAQHKIKDYKLDENLTKKKQTLHDYNALATDINLHKNILEHLKEKTVQLGDSEADVKLEEIYAQYNELAKKANECVEKWADYVNNHEIYIQVLEKCRDWLSALSAEATLLVDEISTQASDAKMIVVENLLAQKEEGDRIIRSCKDQLDVVLDQTAPEGHPALIKAYEDQVGAWNKFLSMCSEAHIKLNELFGQYAEFKANLDELEAWIKQKENQVKDQSLKNTLKAKEAHLEKLLALEKEILSKSNDVKKAADLVNTIDDTNFIEKVSNLVTRYESLINISKENIHKYESFIKDHKNFNENYNELIEWLTQKKDELQDLSHIVGDVQVLQDRQEKIKELIDMRNRRSEEFENLIQNGEKLYSHTSPEGREIIRQQLRNIRTIWDGFTDDLQGVKNKLEQCLTQFADFSTAQEELTRWLRDVEKAMLQHNKLNNTLQEKRAQLQNHKIMNQEITSHQTLVENVCEKAQHLVDQTSDKSLNVYLQSIKQLFQSIVEKSQDLLTNLGDCVDKHNEFNNKVNAFKNWLNKEIEQIQELNDITGEKGDINTKLFTLKMIKNNEVEGNRLLDDLKQQLTLVAKSTAPKGVEELKIELQNLQDSMTQHYAETDKVIEKLESMVILWQDFEDKNKSINDWLKTIETKLRSKPLQSTLAEKQEHLETILAEKNEILGKEKEIDAFVDSSHALIQKSEVQRIKPLISQISARYHNLLVQSKDAATKWQEMVDNHRKYQEKLDETSKWLQPLEEHLKSLQSGDLVNDVQATSNILQLLLTEREQGDHKINSLTMIGEQLFPYTEAKGREIIRNTLRNIRERWDVLEEGIKEQQKLQDAQSTNMSMYQDILQQVIAWLDSMEKVLHGEPSTWTTMQEIKVKLLKFKTTLQEIISHKKVVDGVTEKGRAVVKLISNKEQTAEVLSNISTINKRYKNLQQKCEDIIKQFENSIEIYQQFYDLQKEHQEYQKILWDKLSMYSDHTGNKQILQNNLAKINEIKDLLTDNKLKDLEEHVETKATILPARIQEGMQRDIANLKYDFDKFVASHENVTYELEEKLKQWNEYENAMDRLLTWLGEAELTLKNFVLQNTLEEKQEQLDKYQVLAKIIDSHSHELKESIILSDHLEQALILSLRQTETELDKLSDESTELVQTSGDTHISVNMQQITSRFQSVQSTTKEIVKKCEQAVNDHKQYNEKYRQCTDWIAATQARFNACKESIKTGTQNVLAEQLKVIEELLSQQTSANLLLNNTIELGEKLYSTTAAQGREIINQQLQNLQQAFEGLFDNISSTERDFKAKLSRWIGFDESVESIKQWLKTIEQQLPQELILRETLEEKQHQLQAYRNLLYDAVTHQQDIVDLRDKVDSLPDKNEKIDQQLGIITEQHSKILKRGQRFVEKYETFVSDHQQFNKGISETEDWIVDLQNNVILWGDTDVERITLCSNLERLKNLYSTLPEETIRITSIKHLSDKVIAGTKDTGQPSIRSQSDSLQQEWAKLMSSLEKTIEAIEAKLENWSDYEDLKEKCQHWLRETDTKLHQVDLKATLPEKEDQLATLKELNGEIRAKELEIDRVTERGQQLKRIGSQSVSDLGIKYQQIFHKVKDLTSRWQQYVNNHQDFETKVAQCQLWLDDIRAKLLYCSDLTSINQKELEVKLAVLQDLILFKEEGYGKIQNLVELVQIVLANTAPSGHEAINNTLTNLQEQWSSLASKMIETKAVLDDSILKWTRLLEQTQGLNKTIEWLETQLGELSQFQSNIPEKKAQLSRIKNVEEKVRCEKIEVDNLKSKAADMLATAQQSQARSEAKQILDKFDELFGKIQKLLYEREQQYQDHKSYKEAYEELQRWLTRAQEKLPQIKQRPLSDKMAVENFAAPLDTLLNKQAQGEVLLDNLEQSAEVVIPSTSGPGQEIIRNETRAIRESYERLFKDLREQRDQLEKVLVHWRDYKDEYERLSDWLQQIAILTKNQKIALSATLQEKAKQVEDVKEILHKLKVGRDQIDKFNESAKVLLKSPLDTYVNNQLQQLNSRYQVELNFANDVLKKVETNFEQHQEFNDNLEKSKEWISNARELIRNCSDGTSSSSKEELQSRLDKIQDLLQRREEGQSLVHTTINNGEKVLRNTRSDGKETINNEIKDLQTEWERLVKKMSTAKVNLETALLQWADYDSSYNQLRQWITDREAKLQQVCEQRVVAKKGQSGLSSLPIGERKATLRETNNIVQDIESFEPMIQSVTSKAEDLMQGAPASEISTKYESLSKQAKELYAKQKETVEQHQAFVDAVNDFMQWIRIAKEKLSKCSEPTGDKETLSSKLSQLKVLLNEQPIGQKKLEDALEQGDLAVQCADEEDKEIIEEELGLLQDDFDNYVESLTNSKSLLEVGIVKWTEYEEQYQDALEWLAQTEELVQSYNKLQDGLEEKRMVLEQFQLHLQTLFDWQKDLDRLNMKAQSLLETCADTRISNAVTQMSTKYNAILSLAKEIMRRLELHYQEHQQHNALYQECQDWVYRTREKLNQCSELPNVLSEVNNKLQTVKGIRASLEQGQNKLRYILELKEKVIMNTEQSGAVKIQEDTENLQQDMEKLLEDVNEARNKLQNRATQLESISKMHSMIVEWLQDVEHQIQSDKGFLNELSEKKAQLEKYKNLQRDIGSHSDLFNKLKSAIDEDESLNFDEYNTTFEKYDKLKKSVSDNIQSLENQVKEHEQYKQIYQETSDWIRNTHHQIQQCSNLHDNLDKTKEKYQKISEIISSLSACDDLIHKTIKISISVMKTTGNEGQSIIKQEIEQLKNDWEGLQYVCKDTEKSLKKCIEAWELYLTSYNDLKQWIETYRKKIDDEKIDERKTPEDLERTKNILKDITMKKPEMEQLNDNCESLMEQSACSWIRDQTVQLQGMYTNLLTNAQGLVSKVEKSLSDLTEFIKAKEKIDEWLKNTHTTLQTCLGEGDESVLKEKMETVVVLLAQMPEGQNLLTSLQEAFTKAIDTVPPNKQEQIRDDLSEMRNSFEQLSMNVTSLQAQIKAGLSRWDDFNLLKKRLESWLSETENTLQQTPNTKGELSEIKTSLEFFKNLQNEIANKNVDLNNLQSEASVLSTWAKQSAANESVKLLNARYNKVVSLCDKRKQNLETEMNAYNIYHQSLQDTEKWLLQISFHLMAHNSLYISNREQTEEQISQHEVLLDDIQKYQSTLDDLKSKGHGQIERYSGIPTVKDVIEKQLNNVQESYNSLLQTAVQIKNRLLDSLAKFKEYEATIDSISNNLDKYEPILDEEMEKPINNLQEAKELLETARGIHNFLQNEKSRLALAVQACEAATASISRPSSPRDTLPPPIPIKELEVRARLEDLIDQVQNHLGNLTSSVAQFESKEKQRAELKDWILSEKATITDWALRPSKLRSDAAKQDITNMNDLLTLVGQKRIQLNSELTGPDDDNAELEQLFDDLELKINNAIVDKQGNQQLIEDYLQNIQATNAWFDNLSKRIDVVDKGSGMSCVQKQSVTMDLQTEFDDQAPKRMEEIKRLAAKVMDVVNNLDAQQIEEQLKSVERKKNDVAKRLQRKLQVLETTKKRIDDTRNEIEQARDWVKQKAEEIKATPLGFESRKAEEKLEALNNLLKQTENKIAQRENLATLVSNMVNELEPIEQNALEAALDKLGAEQDALIDKIKSEISNTASAVNTRKNFEANLEAAKRWLKAKNSDIQKLSGYLPLKSTVVEKEISQHQVYDTEIKEFYEGDLNDLLKLGHSLLKDCSDEDKERLNRLLKEVEDEYDTLKHDSKQKIMALTDLLQGRRQFEGDLNKCVDWLKEAEVATSDDIRASSIEILEEQLEKYLKLSENAKKMKENIDKVNEQAKAILPTISESDKITLNEQLKNIKDRYAQIVDVIQDRTNSLKYHLHQQRDAAQKIAESLQFMQEIQNALKDLNKPIGSKVEDVKNILQSYEKILGDLKSNRAKLAEIPSTSKDLQGVLSQQDDLMKSVEDQIARLKQLLLIREQYIALITEIMNFITKYTEVVRDIEKSGKTVEEKIENYGNIINKIQECEALLATAYDKGQQIIADGSAQDRNDVTEQLQSLKQSLQNLRREVERQKEKHENTALEHKKLAAELDEILDWLHGNEATIRSRPLLNRDIQNVITELAAHGKLAGDVNNYLDRVRHVQDKTRHDDGMPGSLIEKLSEASSLLQSLPRELEERKKYLENNKALREEYEALKLKLYNWVKEAEIRLQSNKDGVDFANIVSDLEEHKIFFSTEASMKELVSILIQQAADKIWPSLTAGEREELSREQQQHTQVLKNTLNSAKSERAQLEQDAEIWKEYCQMLDKVKSVISRTKFVDEPVCTLAGLHFNTQKISHALNDVQNQQGELDLLLERVNELIKRADKINKQNIGLQSSAVSNEWYSLISDLESRRDTLTKLAQVWETFEGRFQHFEGLLVGLEEKSKHIDLIIRSKQHVTSTIQNIEILQSEADSINPYQEEVTQLSKTVLLFLGECSSTSADALSAKLKQLSDNYERLTDTLNEQHKKSKNNLLELDDHFRKIQVSKSALSSTQNRVIDFYVFDQNFLQTELDLNKLQTEVKSELNQVKNLIFAIKNHYLQLQQLVPSDLLHELNTLELLTEEVANTMDDKEKEFKKARTVRSDYLTQAKDIQNWIKEAELKIQDRSIEPYALDEHLQQIQSELLNVADQVEKLTKNGKIIIEKTRDDDEKKLTQSTIDNLADQLKRVRSLLDEKKQQVGGAQDAWKRFLELYKLVMVWVKEKKKFIQEPFVITTLAETKQKLHDYGNAVKGCKTATKNLSDMAKELDHIASVTSVGDLPQKMEEAEEAKVEVESKILETNAHLQETYEEWEQCEKKMKDVRSWIDKTKSTLESPQNKKKPLRDQHALREKLVGDCQIQKTKISLSVEKLQIHFRSGIGGDAKIAHAAQELLDELDQLNVVIKDQSKQLEVSIAQVDRYQVEVQQLRHQIIQLEQQLRIVLNPTQLVQDSEQMLREQQVYRDHIRSLQEQLKIRNDRIQQILETGEPFSDTLIT